MTDPNRHLRTGTKAPWPKGKPRNKPTSDWLAVRKKLAAMYAAGEITYTQIALACGVTRATARRWFVEGGDNPSARAVKVMRRMG